MGQAGRRGRAAYVLYKLRASFWFLPGVMAAGAFASAIISLWLDGAGATEMLRPLGVPFNIDQASARALLSTLAGAMVTVVSLVFSLTLVTLTVAAGNLGVRLLERYMQNRVTQVTMGLFVGTFVYSIVVLSTVGTDPIKVPALSVSLALLHSLISVGWLIYAFHDLARGLQIDQAAARIATALHSQIDSAAALGRESEPAPGELPPPEQGRAVRPAHAGYVESVDWQALAAIACDADLQFDVVIAQGDYVTEVDTLLTAFGMPSGEEDAEPLEHRIRGAVTLGTVRTEADDLMFLVHLLIEIACRALSPAVNDLYTALACADHLAGSIVCALQHRLERITVRDAEGRLRIRSRSADVARMADTTFATLRRNGGHNVTFTLRLVGNVERLAPVAAGHPVAPILMEHLDRIAVRSASEFQEADRDAVQSAVERARGAYVHKST